MKKSNIETIKEYEKNIKNVQLALEKLNTQKKQLIDQFKAEQDGHKLSEIENKMRESLEKYNRLYSLLIKMNNKLKKIISST